MVAVKLTPRDEIYVLEEISDTACVACGLWQWVTEEQLKSLAEDQDQNQPLPFTVGNGTQHPAAAETLFANQSPKKLRNKKGVLARKALLPDDENIQDRTPNARDSSRGHLMSVPPYHDPPKIDENHVSSNQLEREKSFSDILQESHGSFPKCSGEHCVNRADLNPEIELERLATQYLETLYLSIASIAFFAKGPLARARNAHLQDKGDGDGESLSSQFFENHILPEKKFDIKYKETLPEMIRGMALSRDPDGKADRKSVRRSRRKTGKPGKDGLLGPEADFVSKWWLGKHEDEGAPEAVDLRALLRDLQTRETQLQILYILEALILEQPAPRNVVKREQEAPSLQSISTKFPRKQKKADLNTSLEILLDRLCIWHTVEDGVEAQVGEALSSVAPKQQGRDKLREFCTEVIIPFYGSKLPIHCKMVSRKLGGLASVTPFRARPPLSKSATTSALPPGSAVLARHRPTQQQSLQRVLSDDRDIQRSRSPSISRSSTMSSVPALKREPSESGSRPGSRENLSKNSRFDHREVDLEAVAKKQHSKLTRINSLVEQKRELDAAIDGLRKPNRTLQARDFVDSAERRAGLFPSKYPQKRFVKDDLSTSHASVQVSATPKKRKVVQSQPVSAPSVSPRDRFLSGSKGNAVPSPSVCASLSQQQHSVQVISTTPSAVRIRSVQSLQIIRNTPLRMTKSKRSVQMTPLRNANVSMDDVFRTAPILDKPSKEVSIYESLGWENEGDDFI